MAVDDRELEVARSLGKLEAQVRELIHDSNSRAQRDSAADNVLGSLQGIPEQLSAMETRLNVRLVALEKAHIERTTRDGVLAALIRSPVVTWIVMVAGLIWATISGKVNWNG